MSDTTQSKIRYDKEFKQESIRLALSCSQPISQTARELGLKESTLYSWVVKDKKARNNDSLKEQNPVDLYEELKKLRQENAKLKEESEILKKAAKYFAKESR